MQPLPAENIRLRGDPYELNGVRLFPELHKITAFRYSSPAGGQRIGGVLTVRALLEFTAY